MLLAGGLFSQKFFVYIANSFSGKLLQRNRTTQLIAQRRGCGMFLALNTCLSTAPTRCMLLLVYSPATTLGRHGPSWLRGCLLALIYVSSSLSLHIGQGELSVQMIHLAYFNSYFLAVLYPFTAFPTFLDISFRSLYTDNRLKPNLAAFRWGSHRKCDLRRSWTP